MSIRPRHNVLVEAPVGSMYAPAVDFKRPNAVDIGVGVALVHGKHFSIDVYYGKIANNSQYRAVQPDTGMPDQKYLAVCIYLLQNREERMELASVIIEKLSSMSEGMFAKVLAHQDDAYVCGSPAQSFYAVYYKEPKGEEGAFDRLLSFVIFVLLALCAFVLPADGWPEEKATTIVGKVVKTLAEDGLLIKGVTYTQMDSVEQHQKKDELARQVIKFGLNSRA